MQTLCDSPSVLFMGRTLADRVREAREEKGMSQAALARACGVNQQTIQKVETGRTLQPGFILELADALDTDPYYLSRGEPAPGKISPTLIQSVIIRELIPLIGPGFVDMTEEQVAQTALHIAAVISEESVNPQDTTELPAPARSFLSSILSQISHRKPA